MPSKTVMCVVGTRPEAIKMAPVILALRDNPGFRLRVVLTGQHQELLQQALGAFGVVGDRNLAIMRDNQSLADLTSRLLQALDPVIGEEAPDLLLAQGDTTTVMVAAMAAFYRNVPFGHVEAGLRTGNLRFPFPEEFNRIVAGRVASLNFAPTEGSRRALLAEGIPEATITVTGNTVIDALFHVAEIPHVPSVPLADGRRVILLTMHRRENFGAPMRSIIGAIREIAARFPDVEFVYPVHPNPNVRALAHAELGGRRGFTLTEPLDYTDLVSIMKRATLVLTDSGGLQEEAPALGKPVLVLRAETERPEAVDAGVAKLVGTDKSVIIETVTQLLTDEEAYRSMARGVSPYGDGQAAKRIARLTAEFLGV